jgi:ferredoxin
MPQSQNRSASFRITLVNRGAECYAVDAHIPLLDALELEGVSLPYGCRYGGCISCAAKLLSGTVDQRAGVALNARQLAAGYALLCVARPLSDCTLEVGVDSHDQLYRNPFKTPTEAEMLAAGTAAAPQPSEHQP